MLRLAVDVPARANKVALVGEAEGWRKYTDPDRLEKYHSLPRGRCHAVASSPVAIAIARDIASRQAWTSFE